MSMFLMFIALVCFILAAVGAQVPRVNLVALGLAAWVASTLV